MNGTSVMEDVENGAYTVSDVTGATSLRATFAIDAFAITVSQRLMDRLALEQHS